MGSGDGWTVAEVLCTAGPDDTPFEEQHDRASIGIVLQGTFEYQSTSGQGLMVPGAFLLGNPGDSFVCRHDHGRGDRCLAFSYAPGFFEELGSDLGVGRPRFGSPRVPPLRDVTRLSARAFTLLASPDAMAAEQLAIDVASAALTIERGVPTAQPEIGAGAMARVSRVVRMAEHEPDASLSIAALARVARLSPFHFIRTFEAVLGTTPHQFLMRLRLRRAAVRLRTTDVNITDIAFASGFGDISNFVRGFRREFGITPSEYRQRKQVAEMR